MQHAVHEHAVQLFVVGTAEEFGVRAHRIERNIEIARKYIGCAVVEGDDVGVIVVLKITTVHIEDFLIVAKNVVYLA